MCRNILLVTSMLLLGLSSFSQVETFYATITTIPYAQGRVNEILKTNDNNLVLLISNPTTPNHIMKVDTLGNILWERHLIRENNFSGHPKALTETSDSGFLVGTTSSNHQFFTIVKINKNGNYEWAQQSDHSESNTIIDLATTTDGGFAMLTSGCTWNESIAKFNTSGTNQWKYKYINTQANTVYTNLISDEENKLVASGVEINNYADGVSLCSLDESGNLL